MQSRAVAVRQAVDRIVMGQCSLHMPSGRVKALCLQLEKTTPLVKPTKVCD